MSSIRRECIKCRQVKFLEDFALSDRCRGGRTWECLKCRNARRKQNRELRRARGLRAT